MTRTDHFKMILQVFRDVTPVIPSGILAVVLLSCALFGIQTYFNFPPGIVSVGASVFVNGHIHRLFVYPFHHKTLAQLLLNIVVLIFLSGGLEKGVGTVRFLASFFLLSTTTGLLYSFLDLLMNNGSQSHAEGLVPVALACFALTTTHTKMTKGILCGVTFPTMVLPWVFVIITTAFIPHTVLPCNIIATLIGWMHGRGWFAVLDISEARAGILEKMMPFRFLRIISTVMFVPASTEERRKTLLPQINPTPGSYPVQAYAPVSSINTADSVKMFEGWPMPTSVVSRPTPPLYPHGHGHGHGSGSAHSFGTSHGHPSEQSLGQSCNHSHLPHSHSHM